jgi:fumarate reductase subunit D
MLGIAVMVLIAGVVWHINVFDIPRLSLVGIEQNEIGDIAVAFLLVIPAFFLDRMVERERAHDETLRAEQLRVLKATMRTVQDLVNNSLNELQLLRVEAAVGEVRPETLRLFDETIQRTAAQLTALGNAKLFAETTMVTGTGVLFEPLGG